MAEVVRVDLGQLAEVGEGEMVSGAAGPFRVLVCRAGGQLYAIEDVCSHAESTLSEGELDGCVVTCPLHFAQFDVRDGRHLSPPAFKGVRSFRVLDDGVRAFVEVPAEREREADPGVPPVRFRTR